MRQTLAVLALAPLLALGGCAQLGEVMKQPGVEQAVASIKPTAAVVGSRVTSLDFEKVSLAFDVQIDNPNPIGFDLSGFDYELLLNGESFFQDQQTRPIQVAASGSSKIEVPVTLEIQKILNTHAALKGANDVGYELKLGLSVDVPVLGQQRVPVTQSGSFPIPRLPSVKMGKVKVDKVDFMGATLMLELELDNPNSFGVNLDKLNYNLEVNGKHWATGSAPKAVKLAKGGSSKIQLPVSLNFATTGAGLYQAIVAGSAFDYKLKGDLDATADNPLLGTFTMPFSKGGKFSLGR